MAKHIHLPPPHILDDLMGRLAVLHPLAIEIDKARGKDPYITERIYEIQKFRPNYKLIFINEPTEWYHGEWHYWVAEIGDGYTLEDTNWWLFCLPQLIICKS